MFEKQFAAQMHTRQYFEIDGLNKTIEGYKNRRGTWIVYNTDESTWLEVDEMGIEMTFVMWIHSEIDKLYKYIDFADCENRNTDRLTNKIDRLSEVIEQFERSVASSPA